MNASMEALAKFRKRQLHDFNKKVVKEFDELMKIEMGTEHPVFPSMEAFNKRFDKFMHKYVGTVLAPVLPGDLPPRTHTTKKKGL
jgi:hypothetical protein